MQRIEKKDRVYINSYSQKQDTDNDVRFRIDLGRTYNGVIKVELQQYSIENKFANFYKSYRGQQEIDFSDFSYQLGATTYNVLVKEFLTIDNLKKNISPNTGIDFTFDNDTLEGNKYPLFPQRIMLKMASNFSNFIPLGFGFDKLGFTIGKTYVPNNSRIYGDKLPDLGQPSGFLIDIQQFKAYNGSLQNRLGSSAFFILNDKQFGDRLSWQNSNDNSHHLIQFQQPQSLQFLDFNILSCDQKEIYTVSNSQGVINDQDLEVVMVFTITSIEV